MTLPEFLEWVKGLGTAAGPIFALLWWMERSERKDAHSELRDIAKESTTVITRVEGTVGQLISVFKGRD